MRTVAIIQARLNSQRLPYKVLKHIGNWPAIYHTAKRVMATGLPTVVATVNDDVNETLASYLNTQDIPCFQWGGPEVDVLGRCKATAELFKADVIVRITGDCPFIDPETIKRVVMWREVKHVAYASNIHPYRTFPRGLDVEVFTRQMLDITNLNAHGAEDREHVTPWMRWHLGTLIEGVECYKNLSKHRWCLDTLADYDWFRTLAKHINTDPPHPTFLELMDFLNKNPDMARTE